MYSCVYVCTGTGLTAMRQTGGTGRSGDQAASRGGIGGRIAGRDAEPDRDGGQVQRSMRLLYRLKLEGRTFPATNVHAVPYPASSI